MPLAIAATTLTGESSMDLTPWNLQIWLPAFFVLGLVAMGLLFAFIAGCEKV
jgi:hypothetical protein